MAVKKQNKKKLKKKWLHKYRLVVLNEDTFEEQFAMKLTRLNVFIFGTTLAIILIFLTIHHLLSTISLLPYSQIMHLVDLSI